MAIVTVITGTFCLQMWETHSWRMRTLSVTSRMEMLSPFYMYSKREDIFLYPLAFVLASQKS